MPTISKCVVVTVLGLSACASPGERVRIDLDLPGPQGGHITASVCNQHVPDALIAPSKRCLNFFAKRYLSNAEIATLTAPDGPIGKTSTFCRTIEDKAHPNRFVAIAFNGVLYGFVGFLGVAAGSQAFAGADFLQYGQYGAGATGMAGVANGILTTGARDYTFAACSREVLEAFSGYGLKVFMKLPY